MTLKERPEEGVMIPITNTEKIPILMRKFDKFPILTCLTIPISTHFSFPNPSPKKPNPFFPIDKNANPSSHFPFLTLVKATHFFVVLFTGNQFIESI